MTLVYRAVWEDHDVVPHALLEEEFQGWLRSKQLDDFIPRRGAWSAGSAELDVRRADAEIGSVLRLTLREPDGSGGAWVTIATSLATRAWCGFWIDLERERREPGRVEMAAPRLVRDLLGAGGSPRRGPVPLASSARLALRAEEGERLAGQVLDPRRDVAMAVYSPDARITPAANEERAQVGARAVAGVASVWFVSPAAAKAFNDAMPEWLGVWGGAVRLYLPGVAVDDVRDGVRHRWLATRLFDRDPQRAGRFLASRLATIQQWPEPPDAWAELRHLVARPSDEELTQRIEVLRSARTSGEHDVATLLAERDQLLELLALADAEREQVQAEAAKEIARLRGENARQTEELLDDQILIEELASERDRFAANMRDLARYAEPSPTSPGDRSRVGDDFDDIDVPLTVEAAVELAKVTLSLVVIPDAAAREVERCDASNKYAVWASTTWRAMVQLQRYAEAVAASGSQAGFYNWCGVTGGWPQTKLAMRESKTVMDSERLRSARLLPIARDVDARGECVMQSHMKIQEGGGPNIPRIYFHDDTGGVTGKVHVGFVGPHDLMPNKSTN